MRLYKCALLCALLALSVVEPILAKKGYGFSGGRHSYPKSGGLSGGGGHHSYPSSGGLSGGGHGYPSSGGSHGYPSSGGSHGYPPSGGLSGGGRGGSHGYPSSGGSHTYPSSGGSHSYPSSGGLSGSGSHGKGPASVTNIHNHYNYNPPKQITYASPHGGPPMSYPVYHGAPPSYVYQYKDSGSKYGTLLAGLALLNLGTLGTTAYLAATHNNGGGGGHSSTYKAQPGEVCKFGIRKDNGDYEETRIDCNLISSFIMQEEAKQHSNTTVTTVTVTNVTMVNSTSGLPEPLPVTETAPASNPLYEMLPNGTLVPVNATSPALNTTANATNEATAASNPASSVVLTSVTNTTTVTNALDVKGKEVEVTPGMKCYVIRNSPTSNMRKSVPCGLLQTYAQKSITTRNSAIRNFPTFTIAAALIAFVMY